MEGNQFLINENKGEGVIQVDLLAFLENKGNY